MADLGTAYVRVAGDFSQVNSQAVALFNSSKWKNLGKIGGAALAGGLAVAGVGKILFDIGEEFDAVNDKFRSQAGATGKELDKLRGSFDKVIGSVPTDFDTASSAIAGLHQRLDLTGKPLTELARQLTALSKITGDDINTNVAATTRLFGDWSVKTRDQVDTLDRLFRLTQSTGIEFGTLNELMVQFGSPLRQLGFQFDEAAVMFARFEKEGVNMQTLLPGLRMALKNIAVPSDELGASFEKLGIKTKEPHDALLQIFDLLSKDKISEADQTLLASQVFGGRAWADMKAAVEEGRFEFEDLIETMRKGDATIGGTERKTRDFSEQWTLFVNRLKTFVAPVAEDFFELVGKGMKALNHLNLSGLLDSLKRFWERAGLLRDVVEKAFNGIKDLFLGFIKGIKGFLEIIAGLLTGDFKKMWAGIKDMFSGAIKAIVGLLKTATAPLRATAKAIGGALISAFEWAWDKIKAVFQGGADVLKGIVNWIISNVINRIPGVEIGIIGGDGGGPGAEVTAPGGGGSNPEHHYSGGKITKPTAIVGEEAPAHPEYVIATNPAYRQRNLRLWTQAGHDIGIPGFFGGGVLQPTTAGGAIAHNIRSASSFIGDMADAPLGGLPGFLGGTVDWIKDKFAAYIREKVEAVSDVITGGMTETIASSGPGGVGSFLGVPMANWVVASLKYAASKGVSPQPTSGYRTQAEQDAIRAADPRAATVSEHSGTQYPHGAVDYGGFDDPAAFAAKMAVVRATSSFKWPLLPPAGFHDDGHASGTGHFMGGIIGKRDASVIGRPLPAGLQKFNHAWAARTDFGGPTMPISAIAQLAEFFGMPGVAMAQIAHGESGYRPGAVSSDGGYGLWQITRGASGMDSVVAGFGGYGEMLNPIKNAIIAGKMYADRGIQPWFGTQFLTDPGAHWGGDFGDLVRAAGGGAGGGSTDRGGRGGRGGRPDKPSGPVVGGAAGGRGHGFAPVPGPIRRALDRLIGQRADLEAQMADAEIRDAMESSPEGSDLSAGERSGQVTLSYGLLRTLLSLRHRVKAAIQSISKDSPAVPNLMERLEELQGRTGHGGSILTEKAHLDELLHPDVDTSVTEAAVRDPLRIGELIEFSKAVRYGAFDRAPVMHGGGTVPGAPGTNVPIIAQAGERITPAGAKPVIYSDIYIGGEKVASMVRHEIREDARDSHAQAQAGVL